MHCWMLWHGGASYAAPYAEDAEAFDSLKAALESFDRRADSGETYYPCVERLPSEDGGQSAWIFFTDPASLGGDMYPDRIVEYGPRGGLHCYEA
jgi:hypothetical protein